VSREVELCLKVSPEPILVDTGETLPKFLQNNAVFFLIFHTQLHGRNFEGFTKKVILMRKLITSITKPPSPEEVRRRMIDHTALNLLAAEERVRFAQAHRDACADLLNHLKSLDYQGLSVD